MKKITTIFTIALLVFVGATNAYGASSADSIAEKYGYPTVTSLKNAPGANTSLSWEQNVKGYNSNDGATYIYNSTYHATEATTKSLISLLGQGEYIPKSSYTGGPFTIPVGAAIKIDGKVINAGNMAEKLRRLQITYNGEVASYERNLLENEGIFRSGNKSIPISPLDRLKEAYGISGGNSGSISGSDGTNRTTGECIGRGCPTTSGSTGNNTTTGNTVSNSYSYQSNSQTATYVNSLVQLVNKLVIEARAKLELSQPGTASTAESVSRTTGECIGRGCPTTSGSTTANTYTSESIQPNTNTAVNNVTTQRCTGDIYRDLQAAQTCASLAESQGRALGYTISCQATKYGFPGTDASGNNYYISTTCTVNGSSGHGAELLAGYDGGNGLKINSGWKIFQTETGL